jgi:hypothetical protein
LRLAAGHHQQRGFVIGDVGMHGSNDAQVICAGAQMWKDLADFESGLPMSSKLKWGFHQPAGLSLCFQVCTRWTLPIVFGQSGFRVEGVDLRRSTIHKQVDDPFRFWGKHWRFRSQWIVFVCGWNRLGS